MLPYCFFSKVEFILSKAFVLDINILLRILETRDFLELSVTFITFFGMASREWRLLLNLVGVSRMTGFN